ncbi:copper chaperone PCu(A)C [Acidocella sp.]|uniref:copper chaperone PCu(A)C n=1 Tax=Acidocella sp. TaxID=50710 RepID=UPI00260B0BD8|nr:copper chaperone PCu(A)C [Acidocella sp.]
MKLRSIALGLALLLPALPACADAVLTLDHGTVWQTAKDNQDTEGFLQIHNTGDAPDSLTSVSCSIAASTVLADAGGKTLPSLVIPPGGTVTLSANGPHLLINDARYKVKRDGILPCAFSFTRTGSLIGYLNAVTPPHK